MAPGRRLAAALAADLRRRLEGEVRFDDGTRALYATDASNYRQVPIGVVLPKSVDDIVAAVDAARRYGVPVLARGGGTSLAGQCCNVAVVIDTSKYLHRVLEIDAGRRRARVEPGCVLDTLRAAAGRHGLTFGPDPSTHNHCTLGGMIGNNACGVHSVLTEFYGPGPSTAHNLEEMEVLTSDGLRLRVGATGESELEALVRAGGRRGELYARLRALRDRHAAEIRRRFPDIPRRVSGYDLPWLLPERGCHVARALAGSEGTCATILEATVSLVPARPARVLVVLGYPSVDEAGDHIPEIRAFQPVGLEGLDDVLIADMKKKRLHPERAELLPPGRGWLLVEFGADRPEEARAQARALMARLGRGRSAPSMKLFDEPAEEHIVWKVRESGLGATARVPGQPDTWEGWEDSAVPVDRLGEYLRELRRLLDRYGYGCALYGHFGQGCVHTRIDFDLLTAPGIARFRAFLDDASDLVLRLGGSISGEHGDGQSKAELLPKMFGTELIGAFREFKAIWDPDGRMNPGKVVDPAPITAHLRLGTGYRPPRLRTHFAFREEDGRFARATTRCVGVGECRKTDAGLMCPSYMVTREEQHSTRGRARLLFEMLEGAPLGDGWRSAAVKEALDLCLACKGCKAECPVNVDMATYKAEFLAHYYAGRQRPRSAYAFGLIHRWARLASWAPALANFLTQTPGLAAVAKAMAGMAPARAVPPFARRSFQAWFRRRPAPAGGGDGVVLWPDTFNNYFHPETAEAAVEVLEALGYRVHVPAAWVCCGRPLYDYGLLDEARRLLLRTLDVLRPAIRSGLPVVGLEPSCVAVFRDELPNLLADDADAHRLAGQSLLFGDFLAARARDALPRLHGRAVVHVHCHQKALVGAEGERAVLDRLGLDYSMPDDGCCGMAGSFGFEADKYAIAMRIGERKLLPAVRAAAPGTVILADGFSCRTQIEQATGRRAEHLAELIRRALPDRPVPPAAFGPPSRARRLATAGAAVLVVLGLGLAAGAARSRRRR